jgi:hypothetical protein
MSCINVPPPLVSPVLDQKAVQDLQDLFNAELTWLEKCFPLARVGVMKTEKGVFKYPQVYAGNFFTKKAEYLDVRPDNNLKSYCFFESGEFSINREEEEADIPLSVIFWYNLPKLNGSKLYDYSRELAAHVLAVINESVYSGKISEISVEFNPENVFNKYSFLQEDTQYLMYPYGAFKISFNITTLIDDCTAFTDGVAGCEN